MTYIACTYRLGPCAWRLWSTR